MRDSRTTVLIGFAIFTLAVLGIAAWRLAGTDEAVARSLEEGAPTASGGVAIEGEARVTIPEGALPNDIVDALARAGVAADAETLRTLMLFTDSGGQILAGEYEFALNTPPAEILRRLKAGPNLIERITFRPGLRVEEIGDILEREGFFTREEWDAAIATTAPRPFMDGETDFLGYLMPGTYEIEPETTVEQLLEAMLDRFEDEVTPALIADAEAQGWSLREVLTLASVVVREVALDREKPDVASAFRNRLELGMALNADPTVQFALTTLPGAEENVREHGWWKQELTIDDLALDSPYNTYLYAGLIPSPIANPDIESIRAVIQPALTDYVYFVASPACDGSHQFAATLEEHEANVQRFRDSACGGGG